MKNLLLTFDLEEFDLPLEYGVKLSEKEQLRISYLGLLNVLKILEVNNVRATFFVTYNFASHFPNALKNIAKKHEIALHGFSHSDNYSLMGDKDFLNLIGSTRKKLSKIAVSDVIGFRSPRFSKFNRSLLSKAGFIYDSSINPIFVPGRYNNFFANRKINFSDNILEIPTSASPVIRLPLFWIAFRNLSLLYSKIVTRFCLLDQDVVHLVFHPWEFHDIKDFDIPYLIKRNTGKKLCKKLSKYIVWASKKKIKSCTIKDYISNLDLL